MKDLRVSFIRLVVISFSVLALAGCGGGASTSPTPAPVTTTPTSSNATLQGQWQIVAHSNVNSANSILVEANFTQSGSTATADTSSVVLIEGLPGAFTGLAGECDNSTLGDDSASATISGQTLSFTLTEAGSLGTGTSTGSATISSDGTQITGGTYQTPAACGFAADSGSLSGTAIQPLSGTLAGQLLNFAGTTDAVVMTISQSGYTLNAVGTDAGAPISLTGKVIGATFDVTGVVQGQSREYVGVYEPKSNNFRVYDSSFEFLGSLTGQTSALPSAPISVLVTPQTVSIASAHQQAFTATVSNDSANKGVTWAVACASSNGCGTLSAITSASGTGITYTAPSSFPSPPSVTLTATSLSDSTKSATSTITLIQSVTVTGVSVVCSPPSIVLGTSTNCSAVVAGSGSPSQSVTWSSSDGSVTSSGLFTPSAIGSESITATSVEDSTKSGNSAVTVNASASAVIDLGAGASSTMTVEQNGDIDIAWVQNNSADLLQFARSIDHGANLKTSTVNGGASSVQMGIDGQGVISLLAFTASAPSTYGVSTDGGDTFNFSDLSAIVGRSNPRLNVSASGLVDVAGFSTGTPPGRGVFSTIVNGALAPVEVVDDFKDVVYEVQSAVSPQAQVYVTWQQQSEALPECDIIVSSSIDGGITFSTPLNVSNNPTECGEFPSLFVDATGGVNLVWTTWPAFGDDVGPLSNPNVVFFARSTDQGTTFSAPVALTGIDQFVGVDTPQVAVAPDGTINIVFSVQTPSDTIVLFSRSTDGGLTFSTPVTVGMGGANNPTLAVDACGGVDVAWAGNADVFYSRSVDGVTFSAAVNLSNAHTSQFAPRIATDNQGSAFVLWQNSTDVLFREIAVCP